MTGLGGDSAKSSSGMWSFPGAGGGGGGRAGQKCKQSRLPRNRTVTVNIKCDQSSTGAEVWYMSHLRGGYDQTSARTNNRIWMYSLMLSNESYSYLCWMLNSWDPTPIMAICAELMLALKHVFFFGLVEMTRQAMQAASMTRRTLVQLNASIPQPRKYFTVKHHPQSTLLGL